MGLHSCQLPGLFEKVLTDPIRPNVSKNVVKKCNNKKTFLGHFQKSETGSESMSRSVMASRAQTEPDLCISVFTIILVNIIPVSSELVPV